MKERRLFGTLISWVASAHGGHGYVDTANGDRYFVHRNFIKSGDPRPGASAMFSVLPPANPDAKYPRAVDVVFNSNTEAAKQTKITAKPIATNHGSVEVPEAVKILSGAADNVN